MTNDLFFTRMSRFSLLLTRSFVRASARSFDTSTTRTRQIVANQCLKLNRVFLSFLSASPRRRRSDPIRLIVSARRSLVVHQKTALLEQQVLPLNEYLPPSVSRSLFFTLRCTYFFRSLFFPQAKTILHRTRSFFCLTARSQAGMG